MNASSHPFTSQLIDAHKNSSIEANPYIVQPSRLHHDNTVFQTLLPFATATRAKAPPPAPAALHLRDAAPILRAPSPSASERIRAWEAAAGQGPFSDSALRDSCLTGDVSGLELFTEEEERRGGAAVLIDGDAGGTQSTAQPPFYMRRGEVEKRFREQVEVHRGLTRAERELATAQASVRLFRAEQRSRALLQAIHTRQEVLWRRVWPDGAPPAAFDGIPSSTAMPGGMQGRSQASVVRAGSAVPMPAARESRNFPTAASTPTAPTPAASPTSDLLRDILSTFSKPKELRGDASSTGRSVASPSPPGGAATVATKGRSTREQQGAVEAKTEASIGARVRVTASGATVYGPPPSPQPYVRVRYREAAVRLAPPTQPEERDGDSTSDGSAGPPGRLLRRATAVPPPSTSDIAEDYSDDAFTGGDGSSEGSSGTVDSELSVAADDAASSEGTAVSYSSDSFESIADAVEGDSEAVRDRVRGEQVSSQFSSVAEATRLTSSSLTDSVADTLSSESTAHTSRVSSIETDVDDQPRTAAPQRTRARSASEQQQRRGGGVVAKRAPTTDEIVERFLAACDAVNAAATALLHSPLGQTAGKAAPPNTASSAPSGLSADSSASSSSSSTAQAESSAAPASSSTSASARDKARGTTGTEQTPPKAAEEARATLREDLERRLRRVRHLRRFRTHLLRHLELVDTQQKASRETATLLRETQQLSKIRRTLLQRRTDTSTGGLRDLLATVQHAEKPSSSFLSAAPQRGRPAQRTGAQRRTYDKDSGDDVDEEIATEVSSDGAGAESASGIEEDIDYDGSDVGDSVEESIEEEMMDALSSVASGSAAISEVLSEMEGEKDYNSYGSDSFVSEESGAVATGSAASVASRRGRQLRLASAGLDEIEEELADRLAELTPAALRSRHRRDSGTVSDVPSEVEELVDLLPPSTIPSDVDTESTGSTIATEADSSRESLLAQRRRAYVAVKRGADAGVAAGAHKQYMQDSPDSSVFTNPSDADIDTTQRSSVLVEDHAVEDRNSAGDAAGEDENPAAQEPRNSELLSPHHQVSPEERAGVGDSCDDESSDSLDALTKLEMDMALTRQRRTAALRSSSAAPSFTQLYDPFVPPAEPFVSDNRADAVSDAHQDEEDVMGSAEGDGHVIGEAGATTQESWASDEGKQVVEAAAGAVHTARVEPVLGSAAPSPRRRHYAKEDLVAQSTWKARQLHMLRRLRSVQPQDMIRETGDSPRGEAPLSLSPADVALDAAEAAAREEFAQHWGVLESLLHTRFAPSRYEERMTAPRLPLRRRGESGSAALWTSVASGSEASRSSLTPTAASPTLAR